MPYAFYLMPFLFSFLISSIILVILFFCGQRLKSINKYHKAFYRFGGVAIIISFILTLFLDGRLYITQQIWGVIIGSGLILLWGIIDDFKGLNWKPQLLFQFIIASLMVLMGVRMQYLTNPLGGIFIFDSHFLQILGFLIVTFWIVFIMNSINWLDGMDGTSGGVVMIAGAVIFFLSQRPEVNQPPVGIITAVLLGSVGAFLFLNFYPAKIIAGTSGSMFMGFILAILAIFAGAKIATTLLVLFIPIIDAVWVMGERFIGKKSIFLSDKRHLHYRLEMIGWSQRKICLFYYLLTAVIGLVALNTRAIGKVYTFLFFSFCLIIILLFIQRRVEIKKVAQ